MGGKAIVLPMELNVLEISFLLYAGTFSWVYWVEVNRRWKCSESLTWCLVLHVIKASNRKDVLALCSGSSYLTNLKPL